VYNNQTVQLKDDILTRCSINSDASVAQKYLIRVAMADSDKHTSLRYDGIMVVISYIVQGPIL